MHFFYHYIILYVLLFFRALRIPFALIPFPLLVFLSFPFWLLLSFPIRSYFLLRSFLLLLRSFLLWVFGILGLPVFTIFLGFLALSLRGLSYFWNPWDIFSTLLTFIVFFLFLGLTRSLFIYGYCPLAIRFPRLFGLLGLRREVVLHVFISNGNRIFVLLPSWAKPSFSPSSSILFDGVGVKQLFNGVPCPIYVKIGFRFVPSFDSVKVLLVLGPNYTFQPRVVVRAPGCSSLVLVLVHFGDPLVLNCSIPADMQQAASSNGVYSLIVREDWLNDTHKNSSLKIS